MADSKMDKVHPCNFKLAALDSEVMFALQRSAAEGGQVALTLTARCSSPANKTASNSGWLEANSLEALRPGWPVLQHAARSAKIRSRTAAGFGTPSMHCAASTVAAVEMVRSPMPTSRAKKLWSMTIERISRARNSW